MTKKLLFITSFVLLFSCENKNDRSGQKKDNCLIDNDVLFTEIAERILFNRYSKDQILDQRPYVVNLRNDSIWSIKGSLKKEADGGVFYMEMNCKDGRILRLEHTR